MARLISMWMGLAIGALVLLAAGDEAEAAVGAAWCTHATAQKLEGDVDGDGDLDWVCHDKVTGQKWVALLESTGHEERWGNSTLAWCSHANAALYLGDVNGDGKADLVCKDPDRVWVDYASALFYEGTDYSLLTHWCTHAGAQFFLGDQNFDWRADLTCRDSAGYTAIDHADSAGHYGGTDVQRRSPDFEIIGVTRTTQYQVTVRNNGMGGVIGRVVCSFGDVADAKDLALGINGNGGTVNVTLTRLPITFGTLTCSVSGRGTDGLAELFISNNSFRRLF